MGASLTLTPNLPKCICTYTSTNMQQHQCKQAIRQTELSIKTDLLDANCGGALGGILVQPVSMVTKHQQFSQYTFNTLFGV